MPDKVAERLASEAAQRGTSAEDVAAELLEHPAPELSQSDRIPSWVGAMHSGRGDLSDRHEEILKRELGRER